MAVAAAGELFVCVDMTLAHENSPACCIPDMGPPDPGSHVAVGPFAASVNRWRVVDSLRAQPWPCTGRRASNFALTRRITARPGSRYGPIAHSASQRRRPAAGLKANTAKAGATCLQAREQAQRHAVGDGHRINGETVSRTLEDARLAARQPSVLPGQ